MQTPRNRVLMVLENCSYFRDARVGKEARALTANGYRVSVISPETVKWPSRTIIDGVTIYGFPHLAFSPGVAGYFLEYLYATFTIAVISAYVGITHGFDVIHVANPPDCIVPVLGIYKIFGKRIIYDQHDLSPELYVARFSRSSKLLLWLQLRFERLSYQLADRVIVTNESSKTVALSRGLQSESRVTVVRNGPELECSTRANDIDVGLRKKSAHIIAFAGVIGHQDGLDYLCRALASLRNDLGKKDFLCVVLGDGDALANTKTMARDLGIEENMVFVGWVSDRQAYFRYLATADVCAAPEPSNAYNDRSTFVKIMEYMLAGRAIAAFDLPENRVSAEGAALYATPNDHRDFAVKIARLLNDPKLRESLGSFGRRRIETALAWQYSISSLLAVYRSLFESGAVSN